MRIGFLSDGPSSVLPAAAGIVAAVDDLATQPWLDRLSSAFAQDAPPDVGGPVIWAVLLATVILCVPRRTWRYFGLFTTVVHELGHAFAALISGQRLRSIVLRLDHSGTTTSVSRGGWRPVWSGFWGYPAPGVVGAALVTSGFAGWGSAALGVGALAVAASLVFIRNGAGVLITVVSAGTGAAIVLVAPAGATGYVALVLGLALLVGSIRAFLGLVSVHTRHRERLPTSDAHLLAVATHLPAAVWLLLFACTIGASSLVAWLQLQPILVPGV